MDLAGLIMAASLAVLQIAGFALLGPAHTPSDAVKSISGLSQPVIMTLISLFILMKGLEKSGVTRWIARRLIHLAGNNQNLLIGFFTAVAAMLSLFMNNLAAGALLLPSAMEVSRRTGIQPSKLLIPVSYGSLLGGSATYFTTANIIMSDLLRMADPNLSPLGILSFMPTGGLVALAGILFMGLFGKRVLPERDPSPEQMIARYTGSELEDLYSLNERLWHAYVRPDSPLIGHSLSESEIGQLWGITVAAIRRLKGSFLLPRPYQEIHAKDTLLLVGREEKIAQMSHMGLEISPARSNQHLSEQGVTFCEVMLAPHSPAENKTLKAIDFRQRFGLTAVALKRINRSYRTDIGDLPLNLGDSLLVIGHANAIRNLGKSSDWIVMEPNPGDQPVNGPLAASSIFLIAAGITASIAGAPVYLSMLIASLCMLVFGILNMEEAYQAIEWQAIFLIAGMYAVSLAMVQTGLAEIIGDAMLPVVMPAGPLGLAAGAYLVTSLLTQFMGGQVSALITGPIVISAAISMGANPQAIAVATATGCSSSFLTPMGHPINILMIAPGNYKFSDFFRSGWILSILCFLMVMVGLALFWRL